MLNEPEQITIYAILRHEWTRWLVFGVIIPGVYACAAPIDRPPPERDRSRYPPDETVVRPSVDKSVSPPSAATPDQAASDEPSGPPHEPEAQPVPKEQAPPAVRRYRIDPSKSDIKIFVYRTGRAARVGHNHVITGKGFNGTLLLTETVTDSTVDLSIPVKSLLVDDPKVRKESGPDFSAQLSEEDRNATLRNLLSDQVLHVEQHAAVMLHARVLEGKTPKWQLAADITIHGMTKRVRTPVILEKTGDRVVASGTLVLLQSDFGITPFSVLAGALQIKDEVKINYRLVGRRIE